LIQNPNASALTATVRYLRPFGQAPVVRSYTLPPASRTTIPVDAQGPELASTDVSAIITTTQPVDRSPQLPGRRRDRDALGPGGGRNRRAAIGRTYILIANTSAFAGTAMVTLYFEDGTSANTTYTLLPHSRTNVAVSGQFPVAAGRRFGSVVESPGTTPAQIVVERAMYTSPGGVPWAAGTNALATPFPP
jgi:hypothetical protein